MNSSRLFNVFINYILLFFIFTIFVFFKIRFIYSFLASFTFLLSIGFYIFLIDINYLIESFNLIIIFSTTLATLAYFNNIYFSPIFLDVIQCFGFINFTLFLLKPWFLSDVAIFKKEKFLALFIIILLLIKCISIEYRYNGLGFLLHQSQLLTT